MANLREKQRIAQQHSFAVQRQWWILVKNLIPWILEDRRQKRKFWKPSIELRNISKSIRETKEDLIIVTGKTLDVDIDFTWVRDVYRKKYKNSSDPIIWDCTSSKTKGTKTNTIQTNPHYEAKPIYIAETLTYKPHRSYYLAWICQKSHRHKFCWTSVQPVTLRSLKIFWVWNSES